MSELSERRLALCEAMYEAWLAGRKTMTRRVMRRERAQEALALYPYDGSRLLDGFIERCCPYGPRRTPLGITEPFRVVDSGFDVDTALALVTGDQERFLADIEYRWGGGGQRVAVEVPKSHWDKATTQPSERFHSPRFMPLWAVRRWTRNEGVAVERVQDISEADAVAEGVLCMSDDDAQDAARAACWRGEDPLSYRARFRWLWDSINAKRGYPWQANPRVWVIRLAEHVGGRERSRR